MKPSGDGASLALYHTLGKLPEPESTHDFSDEPIFEDIDNIIEDGQTLKQWLDLSQVCKPHFSHKALNCNQTKKPGSPVDILLERLDAKLREWKPETAEDVRQRVTEIIDLADHNALDLSRSRELEQEVLNMLDEPASR